MLINSAKEHTKEILEKVIEDLDKHLKNPLGLGDEGKLINQ